MTRFRIVQNRIVASTLALGVLTACESRRPKIGADGVMFGPPHPLPENLYRPIPVTSHVWNSSPPDTSHPLYERFRNARSTVTIGVLEGEPEYVLGKIADAEFDSAGRVYILDASNLMVRVYDRTGKFLTSFARKGRGPGELTQVSDLHVTEDAVYVVDLGAIHVYRPRAGEFVYEQSLRPAFDPIAMCTPNADKFVHGIDFGGSDALIYRVDSAGESDASFGRVYSNLSPRAALSLNRSRMACSPRARTLVLGPAGILGELHAYSDAGSPQWIVRIDDFRPIEWRESSRGGASTIIPDGGYDRLSALAYSGRGYFIAQTLFLSQADYREKNKDFTSLHTIAIEESSGQVVPLGPGLPQITTFSGGGFLSIEQEPFPRVTIHSW